MESEHRIKGEENYCAFVDVLGYKNIVTDRIISDETKVSFLNDIYSSLFASSSFPIKQLKQLQDNGLFIKSFSDCIYIESKDLHLLLYSLHTLYNVTSGYFSDPSNGNRYRPLLRSGVVKDWTVKFMDVGSLSRRSPENINEEEYKNPVGPGVARAYTTSEGSYLSGMRIIISEEVIKDLRMIKFPGTPFDCYYIDCDNYLKIDGSKDSTRIFFSPLVVNEKKQPTKQYELCWPVFNYNYHNRDSDIHIHIIELEKRLWQFNDKKATRHFRKTTELLAKCWQITLALHTDIYTAEEIKKYQRMLNKLKRTTFPKSIAPVKTNL